MGPETPGNPPETPFYASGNPLETLWQALKSESLYSWSAPGKSVPLWLLKNIYEATGAVFDNLISLCGPCFFNEVAVTLSSPTCLQKLF